MTEHVAEGRARSSTRSRTRREFWLDAPIFGALIATLIVSYLRPTSPLVWLCGLVFMGTAFVCMAVRVGHADHPTRTFVFELALSLVFIGVGALGPGRLLVVQRLIGQTEFAIAGVAAFSSVSLIIIGVRCSGWRSTASTAAAAFVGGFAVLTFLWASFLSLFEARLYDSTPINEGRLAVHTADPDGNCNQYWLVSGRGLLVRERILTDGSCHEIAARLTDGQLSVFCNDGRRTIAVDAESLSFAEDPSPWSTGPVCG